MLRATLITILGYIATIAYGAIFMSLIVGGGFVVLNNVTDGSIDGLAVGVLAGFGIRALLPLVDRLGDIAARLTTTRFRHQLDRRIV